MTISDLARRAAGDGIETALGYHVTKLPRGQDVYLHSINKPAAPEIREGVISDLTAPPSLVAHLDRCNGGTLFRASVTCLGINLFGCVPKQNPINRRVDIDSPPIDIRRSNTWPEEFIVFASYGCDASYVLVSRQDERVRCCYGQDTTRTRREWSSIDDWLSSEIDRVSLLFEPDGSFLGDCEDTLPPSE